MCMVCTTSWTQSRMHWMILNANSTDSYSTWMTGWLWLDDSDFGVSKLPNAAKMGEQPLMQTHQLKEYLRPATICLPGGSWFDVFCCKPEWDAKTIYRKPYKTTIGWCNFPWNLEIKEEIPPITYCNILEQTYCCFFWAPPHYVVPSIKYKASTMSPWMVLKKNPPQMVGLWRWRMRHLDRFGVSGWTLLSGDMSWCIAGAARCVFVKLRWFN